MNEKVKIKNKKTGVIKVVKKSLAGDFLGTNEFVLVNEENNSFTNKEKENK